MLRIYAVFFLLGDLGGDFDLFLGDLEVFYRFLFVN